jgi:hypothetical protein
VPKINDPTTGVMPEAIHINEALRAGQLKRNKEEKKKSGPAQKAIKLAEGMMAMNSELQTFLAAFDDTATSGGSRNSSSVVAQHSAVKALTAAVKFAKRYCDEGGNAASITTIAEAKNHILRFLSQPDSLSRLRDLVKT